MNADEQSFSQRVEETRFAGSTVARLDRLEGDVKDIKGDVRWLRDHLMPVLGIVGAVPTVIGLVALLHSFNFI